MEKVSEYLVTNTIVIIYLLLLAGCFPFLQSDSSIDLPDPGTKYNQTSSPIGGGENYHSIVLREDADHVVHSLKELEQALGKTKKYETIYLPGDVEINLSNHKSLSIPGNVTLASNRGYNGSKGALLYTENFHNRNSILIQGDSVRITGLRIEGPDKEIREHRDELPRVTGIHIRGYDNLEVDNCEIFGWSFGGVSIRDSDNAFIHHNYIHHNRRAGLGYGVALYSYDQPATALIEANYFTLNRHAIAGSGQLGVSYEARYNYVQRNTTSHSFDMHGDHESPGTGTVYAGDEIRIHRNTFYAENQGVVIRGIPRRGAWIYENNFVRAKQDVAVRQRYYYGNMQVYDNIFKGEQNAWYVSWGGKESWYSLKTSPAGIGIEDTYIGDFNGDGRSDLLVWSGRYGYISYSGDSYYGHGHLTRGKLELYEGSPRHLLVGDFNGDSVDDILCLIESNIYIGDLQSGNWKHHMTLNDGMVSRFVRTGDFNGDGRDDIFAFDGINWFVSYEANEGWIKFREQRINPGQILIGKFLNKEQDDIAMVEGTNLVFHSFQAGVMDANSSRSSEKAGPFIAGDFDGDGFTDLLVLEDHEITINYSQENTWQAVRTLSDIEDISVKVGDFNGDGISDIILNTKGLW